VLEPAPVELPLEALFPVPLAPALLPELLELVPAALPPDTLPEDPLPFPGMITAAPPLPEVPSESAP
jgi:hypothetical protein